MGAGARGGAVPKLWIAGERSTLRSWPLRPSPGSSHRGCVSIRPAWRSWPRRLRGASGSRRIRHARAPRRPRPRSRPDRRVERDLGEARPARIGEWERVRLHPHFTERAFAQSAALAPIGMLAGSHHERLDGSGYHRGTRGSELDRGARILAAADCYERDARGSALQASARPLPRRRRSWCERQTRAESTGRPSTPCLPRPASGVPA